MREVHFCKTCDFRLPYCVRSDRQFCGQRCRVWWYWHPGQKRFDFSPSGWGLPLPPRKGHPKTFSAALEALTESRQYTVELEAAARRMQLVDHSLRSKLTALRGEMSASKSELLKELDALRDELEEAEERLAEADQQAAQVPPSNGDTEAQLSLLRQTAGETAALRGSLEQANRELSTLRAVYDEETTKHVEEVRTLKHQTSSATALHHQDLLRTNAALVQSRDLLRRQLEQVQHSATNRIAEQTSQLRAALACAESEHTAQRERADTAERTLAQRDDELTRQHDLFVAAERAHRGTHLVAQSESRSLQAEKSRRITAEQRVEQLTVEIEGLAKEFQMRTVSHDLQALLQTPLSVLIAENREVRGQRDRIDAEREMLAARLLEWMSPGQYLEHAAAADYDITKDPLIQIKLQEIRVENQLSQQQAEEKEAGWETKATARALDPKQTVVEQAYAAALSDRWTIKHKPHKRHRNVEWRVVGIRLDDGSEEYLMRRSERRIAWMKRKQEEAAR